MKESQSILKISAALLAFKKEVPAIEKGDLNPYFGKNYAALEGIQELVDPVLAKYDLLYTQHPEGDYNLTTKLIHVPSGEFFESTYNMVPTKAGPQEVGSLISYQKRYALTAILGLRIVGQDDDGNSASKKADPPKKEMPKVSEQEATKTIKELQKYNNVERMRDAFSKLKMELQADERIINAAKDHATSLKIKEQKDLVNDITK